jgi:hypothetical protein
MTQGVLSFKYEEEKKETGMTAMGGLPVYLDLVSVMGIAESVERHLQIKKQGWTDAQTVLSLILMNLAGGDCVDDLGRLEGDEGFCQVLRRIETKGMKRRERREAGRRWRKERRRTVPSASGSFSIFVIISRWSREETREGKVFIPVKNEALRGLER